MDKVSDDPKRRLKIQSSKTNLEIHSHAYADGAYRQRGDVFK
ncbi:hypothetical protein NEISICOT_00678 [Neisseria sicca ATCC 29256]|uniref:Uncharacterized protein n=1 Tax=Neisseria sicca ATCC 29256 TaxID=547045 RepID=C6M2D9_NEISI|nr:hypothetical protein NEISICOT_00678 [Neisseria sicca ATCC 29256]